jgi:F-type H+-transporting ATPase subunit gamma
MLTKKLDIYVPDGKLINTLRYHGISPTQVYSGFDEIPSDAQIAQITDDVLGRYMAGQLDFFGVVYMRFYSATGQQAQTLTVMPFAELVDDLTTRAKVIWPWELSFEDFYMSPSAPEIVEGLVRMAVHSSIKRCFVDAALSEHLARMVAMRNATDNAEEMIDDLTAEYNRARQGMITRELLDIISGTGALQ